MDLWKYWSVWEFRVWSPTSVQFSPSTSDISTGEISMFFISPMELTWSTAAQKFQSDDVLFIKTDIWSIQLRHVSNAWICDFNLKWTNVHATFQRELLGFFRVGEVQVPHENPTARNTGVRLNIFPGCEGIVTVMLR